MIGCDIEWWTVISMEQRRFKYKATPACDAGAEQLSDNTGIKTVASAHILFSDIIEEKKTKRKKSLQSIVTLYSIIIIPATRTVITRH